PLNGLRFGANRSLGVKVDFIPSLASFEMELGSASMDLSLLKDQKSGYLSGVIYPGKSFFNDVVPILPQTALKVAGAIASPISDSRFAMGGDVALKLSKLNTMLNLSLSDVPLASAELGIDKNGLSMRGNAQASLISALGMNGQATFDASFPGDLETSAWYVDMNGNLSVHGVGLSGATRAHLDRSGLQVDGRLATALGGIAVTGRIDQNGATLRGRANVSIPMVAGATVVSNAVDGVACGYEKITSAAVCGADTLEGWSKCGVKFVASCLVSSCETPKCSIPHTCDDFSRPKACPHNVINPNFNYGTFQGTVDVTIGPGGVQATLSGVCVAGQCSSSPTTSVDLSSSQACVQLPGISQKFCAKF
ncbi:MAG TPA: hypothetical protein VFQ35_26930, partial [Polyangiaceae bacterium]|nr:hypothetical protein [Polyangiaceae bacterium]